MDVVTVGVVVAPHAARATMVTVPAEDASVVVVLISSIPGRSIMPASAW